MAVRYLLAEESADQIAKQVSGKVAGSFFGGGVIGTENAAGDGFADIPANRAGGGFGSALD